MPGRRRGHRFIGMKTSKVAAAAAAGAVLLLPGCGIAMGAERHDEQTFEAPDNQLTVDTDHDVVVEVGGEDEITLEQRGGKDMDASWSDGTLTLRAEHRWFDFGDNKSTVRVPEGRAVTVRSTNGDVELVDAGDGVKVDSDNGDVSLEEVSGAVRAETQNGDINLDTDMATDRVDLSSANGDISASVSGDTSYRVETDTDVGDVSVDVETNPDSEYVISASTNTGDITVER